MIADYTFIQIIGMGLITLALFFMILGVYGSFKYDDFYARILIASKVDAVGLLTLMLGVICYSGANPFSLKVFLLTCLMLIINPLTVHLIARSAYRSGLKVRKK